MEVKHGYKLTEVGVIPEDWELASMLALSRQIMDYRGRTPKKVGMDWGGGDIPALSAGNVKKGFIDFSEECYFGSLELYRRWMTRGDVDKDDILFTTEAPLGNVALIPDDRKYILSQRTILIQVNPLRVSSRFLFQMMLYNGFQRMLADYSSGSTAKGIQRKTFEQLCVAVPPLPEQHAIAAALSDVDALLGGLDRLIAKKRDLKQAAMQQLLTGQTRLPGFHGEWEVKRLGELADMGSGGTPLCSVPAYYHGDIPWVAISDMTRGGRMIVSTERNLTALGLANSAAQMFPAGTVLYAMYASLGECSIAGVSLCTSQAILGIRPRSNLDAAFLYYYLTSLKSVVKTNGQQGTQSNLNKSMVQEFRLSLPSAAEQTVIAAVLSDMDAELSALEARRDKTRDLKQAMMQELLIGKTRLVPVGAAHA